MAGPLPFTSHGISLLILCTCQLRVFTYKFKRIQDGVLSRVEPISRLEVGRKFVKSALGTDQSLALS